jgi:ABC-type transporter Mla subunit MlaD
MIVARRNMLRLFSFVFLILTIGCEDNSKLKIEFEDVSGLKKQSPVIIDGLKVGFVKDLELQTNSKIVVEIQFDKEVKISQDAKFTINSIDLLGEKGITVEKGKSPESIDYQKVQQGQTKESQIPDSSILRNLKEFISNVIESTQNDSLK